MPRRRQEAVRMRPHACGYDCISSTRVRRPRLSQRTPQTYHVVPSYGCSKLSDIGAEKGTFDCDSAQLCASVNIDCCGRAPRSGPAGWLGCVALQKAGRGSVYRPAAMIRANTTKRQVCRWFYRGYDHTGRNDQVGRCHCFGNYGNPTVT